jgi:hypothetical protein
VRPIEFLQLVTRVSHPNNNESYACKWFPQVEPSIKQIALKNKARLVNYMLYAKHSRIDLKKDKLQQSIGEDF